MKIGLIGLRLLLNQVPQEGEGGSGGGGSGGGGGGHPDGGSPGAGGAPGNAPGGAPSGAGGGVETISMPKTAFDERLSKAADAATRKLLKELGFEKSDDVKTRLSTLKTLEDEKKTELEKANGKVKELEPIKASYDSLKKDFDSLVEAQFSKLPDRMKEAIDKIADGDAQKRWQQIQVFEAAGALGAQAGQGAPPSGSPPAGAPATRAPAGAPPPPAGGAETPFQKWQAMAAKNPVMASIFFRQNRVAIEQSRPADQ